jgi:hypothetical protein
VRLAIEGVRGTRDHDEPVKWSAAVPLLVSFALQIEIVSYFSPTSFWQNPDKGQKAFHYLSITTCPAVVEVLGSIFGIAENDDSPGDFLDPGVIFHRVSEVLATALESHAEDIDFRPFFATTISVDQKIFKRKKAI